MVGDEYRPKQKTCNRAQTNHNVYPCAATVLDPDRRNSVGQQQSDIQWSRVPGYVMGQVVGGVLAALFLRFMFGTVAVLGATVPGSGIGNGKALAMEVLLTTGLVNTILGTASGARNIATVGDSLGHCGGEFFQNRAGYDILQRLDQSQTDSSAILSQLLPPRQVQPLQEFFQCLLVRAILRPCLASH